MDFEETVRAVEALDCEVVEAIVLGPEGWGGKSLATLTGTLRRVPPPRPEDFASPLIPDESRRTLIDSIASAATSFTIGASMTTGVALWTDRFVSAEPTKHPPGVNIVTRDGVIWIRRYRPWLD